MKLNNKGFALTSIIYMLIVLFLMILLLVLSNLAQRKVVLDKLKYDVKNKLGQGVIVNTAELPYQNQTTKIYYETLAEAITNTTSGDTIKVLKNITDTSTSTPTVENNKTIILDLNGYEVTLSEQITNNGTLDIYTSQDNGKIYSSAAIIIDNYGTFTTNGTSNSKTMTLVNTSTSPSSRIILTRTNSTINLNENSTLTFSEAITQGDTLASRYTITNNGGTITVNGANIINQASNNQYDVGILNAGGYDSSRLIVNSGIIETGGQAIYNSGGTGNTTSTAAAIISGTETQITSNYSYAVYNTNTSGMVYIQEGNITASNNNTIRNTSTGKIYIEGGTITQTGTSSTVYNSSTGTIEVTGGNINASGSSTIVNAGAGIINVSGNPIITGSTNGITGATGTVTVRGGTITGSKDGINVSTSNGVSGSVTVTGGIITGGRIGIIAGSGNASVTIGSDDGNVDTASPVIISTNTSTDSAHGTGIYIEGTGATGTLNFYDGIVKGPLYSIRLRGSGATQNLPSSGLYEVESGTEVIDGTTYQTAKLKLK